MAKPVTLGGTTLVAHLTAGHTRGCTTWTTTAQEAGKTYNVVFGCSLRAPTPITPAIAAEFERSFKVVRALPCDIQLGDHPAEYNLEEKYAEAQARRPQPLHRRRQLPPRSGSRRSHVPRHPQRTAEVRLAILALRRMRIEETNAQTRPAWVAPLNRPGQVLFASLIGTTIEFFDFYIYATAAVLVFPKLFFPASDPASARLASLATFAIAFLARPFGSALFGHFGDRVGRKTTLVAALLTMGLSTVSQSARSPLTQPSV